MAEEVKTTDHFESFDGAAWTPKGTHVVDLGKPRGNGAIEDDKPKEGWVNTLHYEKLLAAAGKAAIASNGEWSE